MGFVLFACTTDSWIDTGTRRAALSAPETVSVAFPLPAGARLLETAVAGAAVTLDVRAEVRGGVATASGPVTLDDRAVVAGNVTAIGDVVFDKRATIDGNVRATGALVPGHRSGITGTVDTGLAIATTAVTWTATSSSLGGGDVVVVGGQERDLVPGAYDTLAVLNEGAVVLHSGVYVVKKAFFFRGSSVRIDDSGGPVQIYAREEAHFRARKTSASGRSGSLLIAYLGSSNISLRPPFSGAFVGANANLELGICDDRRDEVDERAFAQYGWHGKPIPSWKDDFGSRHACEEATVEGFFYGRQVRVDGRANIVLRPFDWLAILGPAANELVPAPPLGSLPRHHMPGSPFAGFNVRSSGAASGGGTADPVTSTLDHQSPVSFSLQDSYEVSGGTIANGRVEFRFRRPDGTSVTCTYRGQSPSSTPTSARDLLLGRVLRFAGCTDSLPATTARTAVRSELTVYPTINYPVAVRAPVTRDGGCDDRLELLSGEETERLWTSFSWSTARKVAPDIAGEPTLYYAWVYIKNRAESLALRQLSIHVLPRPLFDDELAVHAGKCGVFTNPGDANGTFVPVLIPGITYNTLIDAQTTRDIAGNKTIFDAIIIRNVPDFAANRNGSVRLDILARAGIRYTDDEPTALADRGQITRESGSVARVLTDVLSWVTARVKDSVHLLIDLLARALAGKTAPVTLYVHAITHDPAFEDMTHPDPVMIRGWGPLANRAVAPAGMRVSIIQRVIGLIPSSLHSETNSDGMAVVDMFVDEPTRGSGLCIQLSTPSGFMTDFLRPSELCDFRGYDASARTPGDFQLPAMTAAVKARQPNPRFVVHADHERLAGLYQLDDAAQWARQVVPYEAPHRMRVLTGFWSTTFFGDKPSTSCLAFLELNGTGVQAFLNTAQRPDGLLALAGYPPVHPLFAIASQVILNTLLSSDAQLPDETKLRINRGLFSHEYGHFLLCSMANDAQSRAVDHLAVQYAQDFETRLDLPLQYLSEGFADFIQGQVAGGASYSWPNAAPSDDGFSRQGSCIRNTADPTLSRCFDSNYFHLDPRGSTDQRAVGRIATLLHDMYDGRGTRFGLVPGDGDMWEPATAPPSVGSAAATLSATGFATFDSALERMILDASSLKTFAAHFADRLVTNNGNISDSDTYSALNATMLAHGPSWCDRCRVFALHSGVTFGLPPTGPYMPPPSPDMQRLFETCIADSLVAGAVGPPPEPALRLDANQCVPCAANEISDRNGVCQFCPDVVVGNSCIACPPDVEYDGQTLVDATLNAGAIAPDDRCPQVFWVRVTRPSLLATRDITSLVADISTANIADRTRCESPFTFLFANDVGAASLAYDAPRTTNGTWNPAGIFGASCQNPVLEKNVDPSGTDGVSAVWFGTPTDARVTMRLLLSGSGPH